MGQKPHFFFALKLPSETKTVLKQHCDRIKDSYPFSRWVHEQDYHITLAFLGFSTSSQLDVAKENIKKAIFNLPSFSLTIDSFGFFGRKDSPRIFWAGVQAQPQLHTLRDHVFTACERAEFRLESRPFNPHITIARKWQGNMPFSELNFEKDRQFKNTINFTASEVVLYQTYLDRIPKYEEIASFPLINNS